MWHSVSHYTDMSILHWSQLFIITLQRNKFSHSSHRRDIITIELVTRQMFVLLDVSSTGAVDIHQI